MNFASKQSWVNTTRIGDRIMQNDSVVSAANDANSPNWLAQHATLANSARRDVASLTPASLERSNAQYTSLAAVYDQNTPNLERLRREAHAALNLTRGERIVDLGAGSGKSIVDLSRHVGTEGSVIVVEPCRAMMHMARERAKRAALTNVHFIEADAATALASLAPQSIDAALLMFTHDLLQSEEVIAALLRVSKSGARFSLAGGKFYDGLLRPLNGWVARRQRPYCTTFESYDAPWRKLFAKRAMVNREVHPKYLGIAYTAYAERR